VRPEDVKIGMPVFYYPSYPEQPDSPKFLGMVGSEPWFLGGKKTGTWVCHLKRMEWAYGVYTGTERGHVNAAALSHLEKVEVIGVE